MPTPAGRWVAEGRWGLPPIQQSTHTINVGVSIGNTLAKSAAKAIGVARTAAPTIQKAAEKTVARPAIAAYSQQKATTKTVSRPITALPSISNVKGFVRNVQVNVATNYSFAKSVGKGLTRGVSGTYNMQKGVTKTNSILVVADTIINASRTIIHNLAFGVNAAFSRRQDAGKLVATQAGAATTINRNVGKREQWSTLLSPTIIRAVGKGSYFIIGPESTIRKAAERTIGFSATAVANVLSSSIRQFFQTVDVAVNASPRISKATTKLVAISSRLGVGLQKAAETSINYDILATLRYSKHIGTSVTVTVNVAVDILGRLAGLITGPLVVRLSTVKKPVARLTSVPKAFARMQTVAQVKGYFATVAKPQAVLKVLGKVRAIFGREE